MSHTGARSYPMRGRTFPTSRARRALCRASCVAALLTRTLARGCDGTPRTPVYNSILARPCHVMPASARCYSSSLLGRVFVRARRVRARHRAQGASASACARPGPAWARPRRPPERGLGIRISYPEQGALRVPRCRFDPIMENVVTHSGLPDAPYPLTSLAGHGCSGQRQPTVCRLRRRCWRWPASGVCPSGRQRR